MGLSDNQLEILGDRIAGLYQELENEVIRDIARRVKKTGTYTETAELMAKAMRDTGASPAEIRAKVLKQLRATPEYAAEVAKNTLEHKKAVMGAIKETERIAKLMGDEIVANAGDMSFNIDLSMWEQSGKKITKNSAFTKLVNEMSKSTVGALKNLTKSTGFKTAHTTVKIQNAYQHALDMALLKVTSGTFSFDRAAEDCVRELARSGLRTIDYLSGRTYQLDTAARMCIRTASGQLAANITMQHCDDMGTDLVEVDSHWGARPDHAAWQGKIYSRSGKNKKYPDFAVCRYGEVDGLCGVNCRHTFYPFFEGISTPNKWEPEPEPKQYRGREYTYTEATQKQRQMERDVRATKREIEATKAMGGDTKLLEAKKRKQINEYHEFSESMGIRAKDNRLRVVSGSSEIKNTKSYVRISESRARREAAEKFISVEIVEKGDTILPENIYKDLQKSEIGREAIKYFEDNNITVNLLYNVNTIDDYCIAADYGIKMGREIFINVNNCKTKKKVVETIIHERVHYAYPYDDNQHVECVCDAVAMKHRKGTLTSEDLRDIIKSVKIRYSDKKWR